MASISGYESIPDVEVADGGTTSPEPQVLYPEATLEEAELLGILDTITNGMHIELVLSQVHPETVHPVSPHFCMALALPFITTLALGVAAITIYSVTDTAAVVINDSSIKLILVAFAATCLIWLASAVSISRRLLDQASYAVLYVEDIEAKFDQCVDKGVEAVNVAVADVQDKLEKVLQGMRKKLVHVDRIEKSLKNMDHTLDIPDIDDIATVLEGATHEINTAAMKVKEAATKDSFHKFVPDYLKTTTKYWWKVVSPTLLLCLVLQLGGTLWHLGVLRHYDQPNSYRRLFTTMLGTNTSDMFEEVSRLTKGIGQEFGEFHQVLLSFVILVMESFFMAFFQIGIVYFFTGAAYVAGIVNDSLTCITESTRRVAREQGLYATADSVLFEKMAILKNKLLKCILLFKKIEQVEARLGSTATETTTSAPSPTAVLKRESSSGFGRWFGGGRK